MAYDDDNNDDDDDDDDDAGVWVCLCWSCADDLYWKEVSAALALTTMAAARSSRRLPAAAATLPVTSLPLTS